MTFDEKNQIVILKDASFIDVFALIEFIYKGEVNIGQVSIILFYFILDFNDIYLTAEMVLQSSTKYLIL